MFVQSNTKPTITAMDNFGGAPVIYISATALTKMRIYVEENNKEVGWLGIATKEKNEILFEDVLLFPQEVHSTTTEISPEGLAEFGEKLLQSPDGIEVWNNIRIWGHSHVNMTVSPSGQDDNQMKVFSNHGHSWFIRLIANKKGDMRFDVYDYENGIIFNNVYWYKCYSKEEMDILDTIDTLQDRLVEISAERYNFWLEPIKEEIKEKVKEKSYTNYYNYNYAKKKARSVIAPTWNENNYYNYQDELFNNVIMSANDVYQAFSTKDLEVIAKIPTFIAAKGHIKKTFQGDYDDDEIELIWSTAQRYYKYDTTEVNQIGFGHK